MMSASSSSVHRLDKDRLLSLVALGLSEGAPDQPVDSIPALKDAVADPSGKKLLLLLSDLKQQVLIPFKGPLAFARLTQAPTQVTDDLREKSFIKALTSPRARQASLDHLAAYGALLRNTALPESTQLTGAVIHALALVALARRHGVALPVTDERRCRAVFGILASGLAVPAALRNFASRSLDEVFRTSS